MLLELPTVARVGDSIDRVNTPALLLDLDAFDTNIHQMAKLARHGGVALRPHVKAHKSVAIANAQLAAGAVGICCQKLSEAYPFAIAGIRNIHISNQFVGTRKIEMVTELARHVDLSVCVDHPAQVNALGEVARQHDVRISVLPEVDVGHGRCGVTDVDALLGLVDGIAQQDALRFAGLQAYHGGIQHIPDWQKRRKAALISADETAKYLQALEARGIHCGIVTGGGTGTAEFDIENGVLTEIQPGSYVFMDGHYASLGWEGEQQLQRSLLIASTIMSVGHPGKAICDAGLKSVAVDSGMPSVHHDTRGLRYVAANDEHGILEIAADDTSGMLGRTVLLVPGHCDPTVNLYRQIVGFRGTRVECLWDIDARGLSQ
ncbi:MAG: DSD1 family PLP-dependent enzyme [Burkholderiaceae bacterium]|nr:DSD1 family PLP-dependent enzyme [Burkholderiaceae bacterium]